MARFVITTNRSSDEIQPFTYEVYRVSDDLHPYDVPVALNTVFFTFAYAKVNTAQELKESLMTIQIGNRIILNNSIELEYENDEKRFWIGKQISLDGNDYLFNRRTNVLVPFHCIGDNDEIIDM